MISMHEYSANLARAVTAEGGRPAIGEGGGVDAFILANGAVIAWRCPEGVDDAESGLAARAIRIATANAAKVAAVDADSDRSASWKIAEVERVSEAAAAELAALKAQADRVVAEFAEKDAREAFAPPLLAGDHAGALVDHECRQYVRGLGQTEVVALGAELCAGNHPRMLAALMRSPVPLHPWLADLARTAWVDQQARKDPTANRLRTAKRAGIGWLGEVVAQAQAALPRAARSRS